MLYSSLSLGSYPVAMVLKASPKLQMYKTIRHRGHKKDYSSFRFARPLSFLSAEDLKLSPPPPPRAPPPAPFIGDLAKQKNASHQLEQKAGEWPVASAAFATVPDSSG